MLMLRTTPCEAYRRIDFDARVETSDAAQLVGLCYEQLIAVLGTAIFAFDRGDAPLRTQSLTRALSAVLALRLGVTGVDGVSAALHDLYACAGRTILDSVLAFDATALSRLRDDLSEISRALAQA